MTTKPCNAMPYRVLTLLAAACATGCPDTDADKLPEGETSFGETGIWAEIVECMDESIGDPTAGGHGLCAGQMETNTVGMTLMGIEAGEFLMGSPEDEVGREESCILSLGYEFDETQHPVTLSRDFWIGETEVTRGQFEAVTGYLPDGNDDCESCPVITTFSIGRNEAMLFTNMLSELEGLDPCYCCTLLFDGTPSCNIPYPPYDCEGYRLPTEAEWEYAARAGTITAFYAGGNLSESMDSNCETDALDNGSSISDIAWYCGNFECDYEICTSAQPVGLLDPNAWGLYDMSGNVWEWTNDGENDYPIDAQMDPWVDDRYTVVRGGAIDSEPECLRSAVRGIYANYYIGFRIARTCR